MGLIFGQSLISSLSDWFVLIEKRKGERERERERERKEREKEEKESGWERVDKNIKIVWNLGEVYNIIRIF